jgi:Xaa-Pro aminopeptidase
LFHNEQTAMPTYMHLEPFQKAAKNGIVENLSALTHELRWKKSPAELKLMRESASVACQVLPSLCYCQLWTLQISSC